MRLAPSTLVPWEIAIARSWRKLALTFTSALSLASVVWQIKHPEVSYDFVFRPDVVSSEAMTLRRALVPLAGAGAALAAVVSVFILRRARSGEERFPLHRELVLTSLIGLPVLRVPGVEFDHALFTTTLVLTIGLAFGWAVRKEVTSVHAWPDLSSRQAWAVVGAAYLVFFGVIGFISYWRHITFHSEACDASWEIGAVAGIVRHGLPTVSVAAWLYDGKSLPAPYFNNHVPFVDYLFAPFFAIYRDGRTVVWTQAAFMGSGAFGAHLIGRRWLGSQVGGVLVALLYVLNPSVQSMCLHDVHANIMVIPALLLAVGFMENGRYKTATAFALLAAVCREETPVYAASLGLFWMLSGEDRRRFRLGLGVLVVSVGLEAFFSLFLMPHFGGMPRWDHFNLFFDGTRSPASLLEALVLNPLGATFASTAQMKLDYLAISVVPAGALAFYGWRAGWFGLPAVLLLVPSVDPAFFTLGVNYSAPLVPGAILMGMAGLAYLWNRPSDALFARRVGIAAYVLTTALLCNYLYGNIASKTYKLEYGQAPFRRENQRNYLDVLAYVDRLPPFGPAQKALWEVIDHVPKNAPILTSWAINPQLAHYDVALVYGYSGGNPAPEERVRYIVIDKLPPMTMPNEADIVRLRANRRWKVFYENQSGIIFERRGKFK
jgi:uncharacterized membrane protein